MLQFFEKIGIIYMVNFMQPKWYVFHTYSNQENKVKVSLEKLIEIKNLKDKILSIVIPTRDEIKFTNGERRIYKRKIFPGYVFVEMILCNESWYLIRRTYGVTGFVGAGSKPEPLTEGEVARIFKLIGMKPPICEKTEWEYGESVHVLSGPFVNFIGKICNVNSEKKKLKILVSLFDRETPVELDFNQVEKI